MSQRLQFHPGVPVEVTLAAPGELVSGTWKDVVIYQLQNGQSMYLDTEVAASVNLMEIQPGEKFFVCKYFVDPQKKLSAWNVWLPPETEKARAAREEPELERQLRESIELAQRKNGRPKHPPVAQNCSQCGKPTDSRAIDEYGSRCQKECPNGKSANGSKGDSAALSDVGDRSTPVSQAPTAAIGPTLVREAESPADHSDGGAVDLSAAELPTLRHLSWAQSLLSQSQALIDVQATALDYAGKRYGAALKSEDVRSLVITAFINLSHKGGKGGSNVA
jgi:hypothetical protein